MWHYRSSKRQSNFFPMGIRIYQDFYIILASLSELDIAG
jgi:hypothetical protein